MLLKSYTKEIFRPECNPSFQSLHCIAHLDQDISKVLEILTRLPMTNCRECAETTCMVLATRVAEGVKGPDDCPRLIEESRGKLREYMSGFPLDQ